MKPIICLLSLVLLFVTESCGGTQSAKVDKAKEVAYACATVDIGKTVPEVGLTIFQDVMAVIKAGKDGWKDELMSIGVKYGEDSLACAAKAVYDALSSRPAGAQPTPPSPEELRAKAFIAERAYQYR